MGHDKFAIKASDLLRHEQVSQQHSKYIGTFISKVCLLMCIISVIISMIQAISEDTQNCKSLQTQSIPTEADECQNELTAEDLKKQSTDLALPYRLMNLSNNFMQFI